MNDQDEMFERATETPAFLGCPAHMPSGFDGTEAGNTNLTDPTNKTNPSNPLNPSNPCLKSEQQQDKFNRRTWSFCDGLFPIIHIDTQEGFMARCKINGRLFKESVTQEDGADGPVWTGYIYDKGACVCMIGSMGKGKTATKLMTHAAFMAYVKQLSGGGAKYHNRKGFLRQHAARAAAAKQQAHNSKEGK